MIRIEQFVERVLIDHSSFILTNNDWNYFSFIQEKIGDGRYVYFKTNSCYGHLADLAEVDCTPQLVAIIANNIVYIINSNIFNGYGRTLPILKNVLYMENVLKECNHNIAQNTFPRLFAELHFNKITENNKSDWEDCKYMAREALITGDRLTWADCDIELTITDIAKSLCGFKDIDSRVKELFKKNKKVYKARKATLIKIEEFMKERESSKVVLDWEMELAKGLRSVDAKTVTVHFCMNGKTKSAKLEPDEIIRKLCWHANFSCYDFAVAKRGEEVIEALCAESVGGNGSNPLLTCEHITKVTYGKKVLYERQVA